MILKINKMILKINKTNLKYKKSIKIQIEFNPIFNKKF